MKKYIERFCESYEEARKLKEEIYSSKKRDKDRLWTQIVKFSIDSGKAKWFNALVKGSEEDE